MVEASEPAILVESAERRDRNQGTPGGMLDSANQRQTVLSNHECCRSGEAGTRKRSRRVKLEGSHSELPNDVSSKSRRPESGNTSWQLKLHRSESLDFFIQGARGKGWEADEGE